MAKTVRMNPEAENQEKDQAQKTMRADMQSAGQAGTIRAAGGQAATLRAGGGQAATLRAGGAADVSAQADFSAYRKDQLVGKQVMLNSVSYEITTVISEDKTGEADIYLVRGPQGEYIYKKYRRNIVPKQDVLQTIKALQHPHVIGLVDYGTTDGAFFELMEYATGGTLEQHAPIRDVTRLRQIVSEVNDALMHCHAAGLIHRDIKPENLFCRNDDGTHVLMADFGIASMLDADQERKMTNLAATVSYAAPETVGTLDGRTIVGPEADFFSLGLTIMALWLGRDPFDGRAPGFVSHLIITGNIELPDDLPADVETLIRGLITHNYVDRWGSDELTRWLNGEDVPVAAFHAETRKALEPFDFIRTEDGTVLSAESLPEMARLMIKYPKQGIKHLYRGDVAEWVKPVDRLVAGDLQDVVESHYPEADNQRFGLLEAIYVLDPQRGFVNRHWQELPMLDDMETMLDAVARQLDEEIFPLKDGRVEYDDMAGTAYFLFPYLKEFLKAKGQQPILDTIEKYKEDDPDDKRVASQIILLLEAGSSFHFAGQQFNSFDDLRGADEEIQRALAAELHSEHSKFLCWLEQMYLKSDSRSIDQCSAAELVELIREMPWLKRLDESLAKRLNQRDESGWTDLMKMAKAGNVDACRELVSSGADPSFAAKDGTTAFAAAALAGQTKVMEYLAEQGVEINPPTTDGNLLIHDLIMAGNTETVGWLLQRGVDPNLLREHDKFSLLLVAVNVGEQAILEMLLSAGADPSIADARGIMPLHSAAADDNLDAIRALVKAGAPLEPEGDDFPPLSFAARDDRLEAAKLLIELGANPGWTDKDGGGPLTTAAGYGSPEMVKLLLDGGADPNIGQLVIADEECTEEEEPTAPPISYAVWGGRPENARVLIAAGANPSAVYRQRSLLHTCANEGLVEMMRILLDGGADPNYRNENDHTPLHWALYDAEMPRKEMVEMLLAAGADPNVVDRYEENYGHTPFTFAASKSGSAELVGLFLKYRADASKSVDGGGAKQTPFFPAIYHEQYQSLKLLADAKKGLETKDVDGYTPLHFAAYVGSAQAVQILLEAGAKTTARTNQGYTPMEIAAARGHQKLAEQIMRKAKLFSGPTRLIDLVLKGLAMIVSAYTFVWCAFEGFFVQGIEGPGFWYSVAAGAVALNVVFWYWYACGVRFARQRYEQRGVVRITMRTGILGALISLILLGPAQVVSATGIGQIIGSLDTRALIPDDVATNIWMIVHPASAEAYIGFLRGFSFLDAVPDGAFLASGFVLLMLVIGILQAVHARRAARIRRVQDAVAGR